MNFKLEILANFEVLGISNLSKTVHKITKFHWHLQLKSKWEGKTGYFLTRINSKSQNKYQRTKNKSIVVSFDGFYYQIFVTQAMPPLLFS